MSTDRVDWTALEEAVGLEDLPAFHRAFLASLGVERPGDMPLRRVQQAVERELNRLVQAGRAARSGGTLLLDADLVKDLEARPGVQVHDLLPLAGQDRP